MPDRIEKAAGQVSTAAHELVEEVKKERRSRRLQGILLALALVLIALGALFGYLQRGWDADHERHRQESELTQRLCAAWSNRVDDHALLTNYLATFVGVSERGQEFVAGLESAYAKSDAGYAKERGLTEDRCA